MSNATIYTIRETATSELDCCAPVAVGDVLKVWWCDGQVPCLGIVRKVGFVADEMAPGMWVKMQGGGPELVHFTRGRVLSWIVDELDVPMVGRVDRVAA